MSSVLLSGSVRTDELKQALPRHSPQAGEQSRPCFLQLHQAVLQSTFQLHLTTGRKVSGAGGLSVITGIRVPSVSLYPQLHVEPLDFQSNVAPGSTLEENDISLQTTSEARALLQLQLYF